MNFGFAYSGQEIPSVALESADQYERYGWQIYEHMLRLYPPGAESHVLEVGSGRGGACYFISKYYHPASVTGIDLSNKAIEFCQRTYQSEKLRYITASAEQLPLEAGSIDIVINAESSHAYPDFNKFVHEVLRVIKPGGYFMTTDNRTAERVDEWKQSLLKPGFTLLHEQDITAKVIQSLIEQQPLKEELIQANVPIYFKRYFREFAGMQGSQMYNDFVSRKRYYKSFILQKPL